MKFVWNRRKNQANIKKHSLDFADSMKKNTKTNLDRFDAMTDDMIDTSDIPALTEEFFASAKWRTPRGAHLPRAQVPWSVPWRCQGRTLRSGCWQLA
jgi:hypothetical protein